MHRNIWHMNSITHLIEQRPLIALHLAAALLALLVGTVVMARPKGTYSHKTLGWMWEIGRASCRERVFKDV